VRQAGLLQENNLLATTFLVPVNTGNNSHWILVYLSCELQHFYPINPLHPLVTCPSDMVIGQTLASAFENAFSLGKFTCQIPVICKHFPQQYDSYNCGVFITIYTLEFFDWNLACSKSYDLDMVRLLMLSWMLTNTVPKIQW